MNALSIDTITPSLSVSAQGPKGLCTISVANGGQHAPALLELIDSALSRAGFTARETEFVAVPEGPGSFTGLRLAWSAAKAVSLASECPIIPVPTLDVYADTFKAWPGPVVSVLDAKKARFYVRVFRQGEGVIDPLDMAAADLPRFVSDEDRILITGPDALLFSEEFSSHFPLSTCTAIPSGESGMSEKMLFIANSRLAGYNERIPDHAGPIYVRKSDAEIELSERGK